MRKHIRKHYKWFFAPTLVLFIIFSGFAVAYHDLILPNVMAGSLNLGGLTRQEARELIGLRLEALQKQGIILEVKGGREVIPADPLKLEVDIDKTVKAAFSVGRNEPFPARLLTWVKAPFVLVQSLPIVSFDESGLRRQLAAVAKNIDEPRADVRLAVKGTKVSVLTDTKPGRVIDRSFALSSISNALANLNPESINLGLEEDIPVADPNSADDARKQAERIMQKAILLEYEDGTFTVSRERIGTWIISVYEGNRLSAGIDENLLTEYISQIAIPIGRPATKPVITFEEGTVSEFVPPRAGRALDEKSLAILIGGELEDRRLGNNKSVKRVSVAQDFSNTIIQLPIKITHEAGDLPRNAQGINELIGKATTPFVGSPANRISNIKNGVRFLTGIVLQPGEEFSTLGQLGTIDNTTGYLPELVIKGDRTTPEFGGGLCQVSTTLFRAVMDAGLPVTSRRNHSYRVSYYENDGLGRYIGPGLDATIYEPDLDFKFKNDTAKAILIYGYVSGTKVTFEVYGTEDGRTSKIIGPKLLTEVPSGDPIYDETNTLPKGTTKQIEKPHPGGTATATYIITYPEGHEVKKEFKSYYRPWPARYLVGTAEPVQ